MEKNQAIRFIEQLKEHAAQKGFKDPAIIMSEQTFIDVLRGFDVKTPFHIVEYAVTHIFGMPVEIIPMHVYDASRKTREQIPPSTMMIVDRDRFKNKLKKSNEWSEDKTIWEKETDTTVCDWDGEVWGTTSVTAE